MPTFRCAECGEVFSHVTDGTWTGADAEAEWIAQFPEVAEREIVCDDCYRRMGRPCSPN